ncbi:NAP1-related protein 1-like isoform X2 [Mangifera indica]|uniref:NAP1-related protein 1-like isoform X2 n=1 Tax=Mangifera indica TaxID=29780 RepID=UPI001CF930DC|nr:NAP1-related protein 1-like isoform X2 [Mangifera indica]
MVSDKGKKSRVVEKVEDDENHAADIIDSELVLSIEKLQEVQDELEKVNEEASDKVLEVEQKYNELRRPVYEKRNEIIKSIPDFWIIANFRENPYFENTKLTKTYKFLDEGTTKITGTTIKWKDGMDASNGTNNEKKGNKRPFSEESIFSWFGETEQKDIAELHDEVADIIKEDLWPNPLKYFNNEADEEEVSDGDEGDEEENAEDDDGKDAS